MKEQILIVHLGLGFEETYHIWYKDGDDYTSLQLIEKFVKVCLPLTKTINVPKEAPMEHPRLPEFPNLGTLASDVSNYYTEQAATDNELRLKDLREREKEIQMGIWDGAEYMNEVNWPEKKLKQGYHIEMCFSYLDEDEENRYMWCYVIVTRVKRRDDKTIKVDIKWEESFIACGESDLTEERLEKH